MRFLYVAMGYGKFYLKVIYQTHHFQMIISACASSDEKLVVLYDVLKLSGHEFDFLTTAMWKINNYHACIEQFSLCNNLRDAIQFVTVN